MLCQTHCMETPSLTWEMTGSELAKLQASPLPACPYLTRALGFYILQRESSGKTAFEQRILQLKNLKITALKEQFKGILLQILP